MKDREPGSNSHYLDPDSIVKDIRSATFLSEEWHEGFQRLDQFSATLTRKREQRGGYPWSVWASLVGAFAMVGGLGWVTDSVYSGKLGSSSFGRTAAPISAEAGRNIQHAPPIPTPQPRNLLEEREVMQGFKLYTEDGARFRRKVLFAQISGSPDGNMDIASYNHWKSFLGYEVFERRIRKVVEEHQLGDIVIVEDYVPPKGIFLRKNPSLRFDSSEDPYTYQGDTLRIVGGPQDLIDKQRGEAWRMWKVEQVGWYGRTLGWQLTKRHQGGWIWDEWLGPKHWLYEGPSLADQSRSK